MELVKELYTPEVWIKHLIHYFWSLVVTDYWHFRGRLGNKTECVNCAM